MKKIDQDQLVAAICGATADVCSTMLGIELTPAPAYVESSAATSLDGVVALIGMAGNWVGTGSICCSADFACRICAQLLMTEANSVNEEVLDAVGEVTNMIIGNVKTTIEEILGPLGLSIPTVIFGHNFTTRSPGNSDWVVVPFRCGDQEVMLVKLFLAPASDPVHARASHTIAI
jgi:chemotaxis protein CheX